MYKINNEDKKCNFSLLKTLSGFPKEPADPVAYLAINALASTDDDGQVNTF